MITFKPNLSIPIYILVIYLTITLFVSLRSDLSTSITYSDIITRKDSTIIAKNDSIHFSSGGNGQLLYSSLEKDKIILFIRSPDEGLRECENYSEYFRYLGYGFSTVFGQGEFEVKDIENVLNCLNNKGIKNDDIILFSDGTDISGVIMAASSHSIYGIIAFAPKFSKIGFLLSKIIRFHPAQSISEPLLIFHGSRDEVVDYWNSFRLYGILPMQVRRNVVILDSTGHGKAYYSSLFGVNITSMFPTQSPPSETFPRIKY